MKNNIKKLKKMLNMFESVDHVLEVLLILYETDRKCFIISEKINYFRKNLLMKFNGSWTYRKDDFPLEEDIFKLDRVLLRFIKNHRSNFEELFSSYIEKVGFENV